MEVVRESMTKRLLCSVTVAKRSFIVMRRSFWTN